MPKFNVHIFAVVRVKICDVEAESQIEAIAAACQSVNLDGLFNNIQDRLGADRNVSEVEFGDEITHYLVDEDGDEDFERSQDYNDACRLASDKTNAWLPVYPASAVEGEHPLTCQECLQNPVSVDGSGELCAACLEGHTCRTCGDDIDSDGYDGMCGDCADKAEDEAKWPESSRRFDPEAATAKADLAFKTLMNALTLLG